MAKRLSIKHRKMSRDKATAYAAGKAPKKHKVAKERSEKAKLKNAYRMN
ncbi:MAG: hypothetical protein P4M08_08075 [Oligoflexia bacterium]|nr:hypothetical protein [Oligoflexia bacterium]